MRKILYFLILRLTTSSRINSGRFSQSTYYYQTYQTCISASSRASQCIRSLQKNSSKCLAFIPFCSFYSPFTITLTDTSKFILIMQGKQAVPIDLFLCLICQNKASNAHMCPKCSRIACERCFKDWLNEKRSQCPNCKSSLRITSLVNCARFTNQISQAFQKQFNKGEIQICQDHLIAFQYFCRTCQSPVCADCAMFGQHKGHDFQKLQNYQKKYFELVNKELLQLQSYQEQLNQDLLNIQIELKNHRNQKRFLLKSVEKHELLLINRLIKSYEQRQNQLSIGKETIEEQLVLLKSLFKQISEQINIMPKTLFINKAQDIKFRLQNLVVQNFTSSVLQLSPSQFSLVPQPIEGLMVLSNYRLAAKSRQPIFSQVFKDGYLQWRLKVYPAGNDQVFGQYLSIFVELTKGTDKSNKYYYKIQLINQNDRGKSTYREHQSEFSVGESWGYKKFIKIEDLEKQGFLNQKDKLEIVLFVGYDYFCLSENNLCVVKNLKAQIEEAQFNKSRLSQRVIGQCSSSLSQSLSAQDQVQFFHILKRREEEPVLLKS